MLPIDADKDCPTCRGTGYYGANGPGRSGNGEYYDCPCWNKHEHRPARYNALAGRFLTIYHPGTKRIGT